MHSSQINDKLTALTERFRQRLNDTESQILNWQNSGHIKELIEISHKLAGTAGTYGFHKLSTEMKELELHLLEISDQEITNEKSLELYKKASRLLNDALKTN